MSQRPKAAVAAAPMFPSHSVVKELCATAAGKHDVRKANSRSLLETPEPTYTASL